MNGVLRGTLLERGLRRSGSQCT